MIRPRRKLRTPAQVEKWNKAMQAKYTILDVDEVQRIPGADRDEWVLRCGFSLYFVPRRLEDDLRYVECGRTYKLWYYGDKKRVLTKLERFVPFGNQFT